MNDVRLVIPSKEHEKLAFEYLEEFERYDSSNNGTGGLDRHEDYDEWLLKLEKDLDLLNIPDERVPANTYFLIRESDNKIIGMMNLRHRLNDFLLEQGGHIGYAIRPTERKKGYGTLMLKLGLERCKELNINKVLLTCDKVNIPSAKVIQKNNGILENEVYSEVFSELIQRYWVELD